MKFILFLVLFISAICFRKCVKNVVYRIGISKIEQDPIFVSRGKSVNTTISGFNNGEDLDKGILTIKVARGALSFSKYVNLTTEKIVLKRVWSYPFVEFVPNDTKIGPYTVLVKLETEFDILTCFTMDLIVE